MSLKECNNHIAEHSIALSYVWGDARQNGSIDIDERSLEITTSLEVALQHIRHENRVLRIWADGICINQRDIHDRDTQVAFMGPIYATARQTIIFLGAASPDHETKSFSFGFLGRT